VAVGTRILLEYLRSGKTARFEMTFDMCNMRLKKSLKKLLTSGKSLV